jgi:CheY-like chemotaxis protein
MAIVRSLCGAMRATIDVFSTPGQGTQVTVHVPQRVAGTDVIGAEGVARLQNFEMRPSKHEERQEFTPESMPYGSVLVVDDVRANLYVTRGLLQFYDLHTITCESAAECIALIEGGAVFDVIFMDHMMPEMDGTDALRALRSMGYNEPVVVLTANALLGHAEQFLHDGFDGYLSKPVRSEQLDAILRRYIRDKQPPHVLEEAKNNSEGKVRMSGFDKFQTHPELLTRLRKDFRDEQQHVMSDLRAAISNNDIKKAHFLAHTLKGRAGLLYESALVSAAEVAEIMLRDGNSVPEATLVALENELTRVIASIPSDAPPADHAAALAALDALQPLLAARSGKCRTHLDELRDIPQAAILVQLVENFDFATAEKCLPVVRKLLS